MNNDIPKFSSFFWAGFESTYSLGTNKQRLDLLKSTKHDQYTRSDYRLIKKLGIQTVRESLAWHQIDKGGTYDFSRFEKIMKIGQKEGIQQVWDLNHFDYPEGLDLFSEKFISRFAKYAKQAIKVIRKYSKGTIYIVVFNEISYFSWIAGDVGMWGPYVKGRGFDLKKQLVRASIKAMDAIWEGDSDVRFIQVDPLLYRITKRNTDKNLKKIEKDFREIKYQAWDMFSGKMSPELGGNPKYLDILGINYYYANQEWILRDSTTNRPYFHGISWDDSNRVSFAVMLKEIHMRYNRPIVISETGSHGGLRLRWWKRTLKEIKDAIKKGIPITAICSYPIIDTQDWTHGHLTNSGFWDFKKNDSKLGRVPHDPTIRVVKKFIDKLVNK